MVIVLVFDIVVFYLDYPDLVKKGSLLLFMLDYGLRFKSGMEENI